MIGISGAADSSGLASVSWMAGGDGVRYPGIGARTGSDVISREKSGREASDSRLVASLWEDVFSVGAVDGISTSSTFSDDGVSIKAATWPWSCSSFDPSSAVFEPKTTVSIASLWPMRPSVGASDLTTSTSTFSGGILSSRTTFVSVTVVKYPTDPFDSFSLVLSTSTWTSRDVPNSCWCCTSLRVDTADSNLSFVVIVV